MLPSPGILLIVSWTAIVDQPGDGETLSVAQIDLRFRAARADRGNQKSLDRQRIRVVERTDFWMHLEVDHPIRLYGRREIESHTELAELDRDHRRGSLRRCRSS